MLLNWSLGFDGVWSEDARRRYVDEGFDGLYLTPDPRDHTPPNLDFVLDLPGLRSLNVTSRIRRDEAAFRVGTLETLTLATGSRRPVPPDTWQPSMRSLLLTWRPGIEVSRFWPELESLRVDFHAGDSCRWLGEARALREFELHSRRQAGSLDGIEAAVALQSLRVINYALSDTAPLRPLCQLREIRLFSAPPGLPHQLIDFADVAGAPLELIWVSDAIHVHGIATLAAQSRLRDVRLTRCPLSSSDRATLANLPSRVRVTLNDCHTYPDG